MNLRWTLGLARQPRGTRPFQDGEFMMPGEDLRPGRNHPLLTERSKRTLPSETDMSKPNDLVQGTLDLLLLKILTLEPLNSCARGEAK